VNITQAEFDRLKDRIRQLEDGLKEAIRFVRPQTTDLVRGFSDLDETDTAVHRRNADIRETKERLSQLLEDNE
jgi:hypothetical protein